MPAYLEPAQPDPAPARVLSGRQFEIANRSAVVVIAEVGGGLRSFEIDGEPVLLGYPPDQICSGGKGQVLAPWPNRLQDGSYSWRGVAGAAALDEPAHSNAIHGLVRWMNWQVIERGSNSLTAAVELPPQPGYPWRLTLEVTYALVTERELTVTTTATNDGDQEAPFGIGFHPYLHAGDGGVDECRLSFAAERRLVADVRGLPTGATDVAASEYDFSRGRSLRGRRLDDCFFGFQSSGSAGGTAWTVSLERGDGRSVALSAGTEFPYVMCFTADTLGDADRRRAIAVEPMSCPPNALRTGESIVALGPASSDHPSWSGSWRLTTSGW
ncbi:MAG: aldose 1-epimerase family protein [Acidimicrobiales bacterium]